VKRARKPEERFGAAALALMFVLALTLTAGCASTGGPSRDREPAVHVVQRGENLYRIALHYGVSVEALMRANGIRDPRTLEVGQRLAIPGARRAAPREPLARELDADARRLAFGWPVHGVVTSGFGMRGGRPHQGIDISTRAGAPIWAAADGVVTFSGRLGGYGNIVIIRHDELYSTAYAHNKHNRVERGQRVARGQHIADVGKTGNARARFPLVHFEVRRGETPRDPLRYLP
jgi:murein DD-endopeptidase MepM/ murein hydrolase activator NlpD